MRRRSPNQNSQASRLIRTLIAPNFKGMPRNHAGKACVTRYSGESTNQIPQFSTLAIRIVRRAWIELYENSFTIGRSEQLGICPTRYHNRGHGQYRNRTNGKIGQVWPIVFAMIFALRFSPAGSKSSWIRSKSA